MSKDTDRPRMSAAEFVMAIDRLHLSVREVARLFRVNPRTARRWADGEEDIPPAIAGCLRLGEALIALKRLWYEKHGVNLVVTGANIVLHKTFDRAYLDPHVEKDEP